MINKCSTIADKNFVKVDILNGVRRLQQISCEKNIECFAVYENKELVGIVTPRELLLAHPNRIVADVMSSKYLCVDCNLHIWKLEETFALNKEIEIILLESENDIIGYITRNILNVELGKHIDLLTGLYKRDFMFYNAHKLIRSEQNTTIIFIDLNNFGLIDKKYGHINGDIILEEVAKILSENTPLDCYLCRYAGDEFAVLTPYCIEESKALSEKIISEIDSHEFPNKIAVSASIGICSCKVHNKKVNNIYDLINRLVNVASLSSTKAKQQKNNSIFIGDFDIDVIA
jgi:diguanylate cyclase (GGDEF)-like protein